LDILPKAEVGRAFCPLLKKNQGRRMKMSIWKIALLSLMLFSELFMRMFVILIGTFVLATYDVNVWVLRIISIIGIIWLIFGYCIVMSLIPHIKQKTKEVKDEHTHSL
jgi:uncharacterized protein YqhQ